MAGLQLYNALTRRVEPFEPLDPEEVRVYSCGPTVYDYATIGNMRAFLFSDVLRRTLEYNGYRVRLVMSVTDVGHLVSDADEGEDKMLVGMRRERKSPWEIAEYYTEVFFRHCDMLNILRPTVAAKATEHIPEMIAFVQRLEELGYTYEISDGVYFDIAKFEGYGQLSGQDLEAQMAGARVEINPEKRHPADFALWRKASPEHIMQWDSPWGRGYPGWHIECSAMSIKYLGQRYDIHTGGIDHITIHHEDEIAQNDAAMGHQVVQRWMHNEFLQVDGGRMGKSLGNFYTVDDLVKRRFDPLAFRYFVLNAHYRSKLNFTWDALAGAQKALDRLWQRVADLGKAVDPKTLEALLSAADAAAVESPAAIRFAALVNKDLATAEAMSLVWEVARAGGPAEPALAALLDFDRVLGLALDKAARGELGGRTEAGDLSAEASELLHRRETARAERRWSEADALRDQLAEMGYLVEDTPEGPKLKRK